jgi:hypothetical protein
VIAPPVDDGEELGLEGTDNEEDDEVAATREDTALDG